MQILQTISDFLFSDGLHTALTTIASLGIVDGILRLIKTDKPVSVLIGVQAILKAVVRFLQGVDGVIDQIVPQRLKEEPKAQVEQK